MKKLKLYLALGSFLMLQSCTLLFPAMYSGEYQSHEDFMSKSLTKRDCILTFGPPSEKVTVEGLEIWTWSMGTVSSTVGSAQLRGTTKPAATYNGIETRQNYAGSLYSNTSTLDSYVQYFFEEGSDAVLKWSSRGVNYTTGVDEGYARTIGLIIDLGIVGAAALAGASY